MQELNLPKANYEFAASTARPTLAGWQIGPVKQVTAGFGICLETPSKYKKEYSTTDNFPKLKYYYTDQFALGKSAVSDNSIDLLPYYS